MPRSGEADPMGLFWTFGQKSFLHEWIRERRVRRRRRRRARRARRRRRRRSGPP